MCSRTAPAQTSVTSDSTGWLHYHFSVIIVLGGADQLAENECSCILFCALLLPNCQSFLRHVGFVL
jgi:hypothetical protein